MGNNAQTVRAIYDMREAAERKARMELLVSENKTPETEDAFLDASLDLEEKTQEAIEHCTSSDCTDPSHGHGSTVTDINTRRRKP